MGDNKQDANASENIKLLSCPFCGAAGELTHTDFLGWNAGCSNYNCPATGRSSADKKKTVAFWNTRAR